MRKVNFRSCRSFFIYSALCFLLPAFSSVSAKDALPAEKLPVPLTQTKDVPAMEPNTSAPNVGPEIAKGQVLQAKGKAERDTPDPIWIGFFDFVNNLTPIAMVVAVVCGAIVLVKKIDASGSAEEVVATSTATANSPEENKQPDAKPEETKLEEGKTEEGKAEQKTAEESSSS